MPKLEAFSIPGLDLFFNSLDHLPPHFHARRPGEWEVRVYFLQCGEALAYDVKWADKSRSRKGRRRRRKPPGAYGQALLEQVTIHRAALLREWETKVGSAREPIDE
jgi:hypothetical protein